MSQSPGPEDATGASPGGGTHRAGPPDQAEPAAAVDALVEGLAPEAAAATLAGLINRAAARLHTLARAQAAGRKDQPDWAAWAQLQNASRSLVLQSSTARDLAARLPSAEP
jgi:hypothetical protein